MQEQLDFVSYARNVRAVCKELMASARKTADLSGRMHLLSLATERDLARYGKSPQASRVACAPGCGACCILNVSVLLPEAITVAWYLRRRLNAWERGALLDRLKELTLKTRWLDDEERLFLREPCAFLSEQESCSIHRVRPLLCRSITSTDPAACRESLAMVPLEGAPTIEMDLFHKRLFDTVYCELAGALKELGLDHRPRRLSAAVCALLEVPSLGEQFVAGERIPIC